MKRDGALFTGATVQAQVAMAVVGASFTALCAQATIPWIPVPFTLQSLAVTLCALSLGFRAGMLSQVFYLGAGCAGLPVFAGAAAGSTHLLGPTGGYLVAFVVCAAVLGYASDRGWTDRALGLAAFLVVGYGLILGLGTVWLAFYLPPEEAFAKGFVPFITGAIAKSAVVWLALPAARAFSSPRR
jgi:biotin transport system substrate-specific component